MFLAVTDCDKIWTRILGHARTHGCKVLGDAEDGAKQSFSMIEVILNDRLGKKVRVKCK